MQTFSNSRNSEHLEYSDNSRLRMQIFDNSRNSEHLKHSNNSRLNEEMRMAIYDIQLSNRQFANLNLHIYD